MPYRWHPATGPETTLTLWPHRSLTRRGFVAFIAATALTLALPLMSLLGTPALWMILPFATLVLWALWLALRTNNRQTGKIRECLTLTRDRAHLIHEDAQGHSHEWQANPYWVRITLHATEGPVPNYLTLTGGDRTVELGRFLAPEERARLAEELSQTLARLR